MHPAAASAAVRSFSRLRSLPPSLSLLDTFKSSIERLTDLRVARASHILLKGFDDETVARMEEIKREINDDAEVFAAKATELSLCPSRVKGGDLGFFTRGKVRSALLRHVHVHVHVISCVCMCVAPPCVTAGIRLLLPPHSRCTLGAVCGPPPRRWSKSLTKSSSTVSRAPSTALCAATLAIISSSSIRVEHPIEQGGPRVGRFMSQ